MSVFLDLVKNNITMREHNTNTEIINIVASILKKFIIEFVIIISRK
jgi:hypothetical protein